VKVDEPLVNAATGKEKPVFSDPAVLERIASELECSIVDPASG